MPLTKLAQQHLKERIDFERAKQKAYRYLQEQHRAVLKVFDKGEKIPLSIQQRQQTEIDRFNREWSENGTRYCKLMEKQKLEWERL